MRTYASDAAAPFSTSGADSSVPGNTAGLSGSGTKEEHWSSSAFRVQNVLLPRQRMPFRTMDQSNLGLLLNSSLLCKSTRRIRPYIPSISYGRIE